MPNIYDRSYNRALQDGDDCPPHTFSMAYGGNDNYEDPKDVWDFDPYEKSDKKSYDLVHVDYTKLDVPFKFVEIRRQTEKAWLIIFEEGWAWFPKSLCKVRDKQIIGPHSFMKKKALDAIANKGKHPPQGANWQAPAQPVTIVVNTDPCPYCGKTDACDCASPGIVATRIPAPSAEAIAKLKQFIKENR